MSQINDALSVLLSRLRVTVQSAGSAVLLLVVMSVSGFVVKLHAQETPYFVTYSDDLEEPGNLEIELKNVAGSPAQAPSFLGSSMELEYGVKAWWTTEFYLSGQSTEDDSTVFTGFRWENRFRPLMREHWVNPVLYVEFEDINAADKSLLEVVGHDNAEDLAGTNAAGRHEKQREMELKLILSKNWRGWNFAQNTIFEKNLSNEPWEFGYAAAASRPLSLAATPTACAVCAENFDVGLEMYGGLGDRHSPGLHDTSHYLSPSVSWTIPHRTTFTFGPGFGLNDHSAGVLFRFGVTAEIPQFLNRFRRNSSGVAR